ncbi:MAG: serine hydrolase [Gemmatimonadaceae bacterium]
MQRITVGLAILCTASAPLWAQGRAAKGRDPLAGLDAYVATQMRQWKVPGLALAVVKGDSVILERGYGVRKSGEPAPVDANTIFAIGSSSKAFTAALVAMAVDEGKMKWDGRVTDYLPGFELHDAYATRELTMRDALSHRSGLARGDMMWYGGTFSRVEILRRTRFLKPSWGFRSQFGYQNLMFLAAGEAVARVEGASWDALVRSRIFQPLGMGASTTSTSELAGSTNVAQPHVLDDSLVRVIPWKNIDNIAPAGSINSSVHDMTRWLRLQLGKGRYDGRQLISSANLTEMWQANTHIRLSNDLERLLTPNGNLAAYGMGWFLQDFNGRLAVHHGGNIDGFSAMVAMLPDEQLGVVVLTNMNGTFLRDIMWAYIFDAYTRDAPRDFAPRYQTIVAGITAQAMNAEKALDAARVNGTSPSRSIEKYAGVFSDSMYGDLTTTMKDGSLRLQLASFTGTLEHWHFDTFRAVMDNPQFGKPFVRFVLGKSGEPVELKFDLAPEATFTAQPPAADSVAGVVLSLEERAKYTGTYKPADLPLEILVQEVGGQLRATVPGQPMYTLVPESRTRFRMTAPGLPAGFYLDFSIDGDAVRGAMLVQPAPRPSLSLTRVR